MLQSITESENRWCNGFLSKSSQIHTKCTVGWKMQPRLNPVIWWVVRKQLVFSLITPALGTKLILTSFPMQVLILFGKCQIRDTRHVWLVRISREKRKFSLPCLLLSIPYWQEIPQDEPNLFSMLTVFWLDDHIIAFYFLTNHIIRYQCSTLSFTVRTAWFHSHRNGVDFE